MYGIRLLTITSLAALSTCAGAPGPMPEDDPAADAGLATETSSQIGGLRDDETTLFLDQVEDAAATPPTEPQVAAAEAPDDDDAGPVSTLSAEGSSLEVTLSDDYIQGRHDTGKGLLGFDNAEGHIGAYLSDKRDLIGFVGLLTEPFSAFREELKLSIGGRGYLGLLADPTSDVFALAPGIEGRYALPIDFEYPLHAVGGFYLSPNILTLGDASNVFDLDLRLEAEITPRLTGLIGYRQFSFDLDEGDDKDAASEFQIGARFAF